MNELTTATFTVQVYRFGYMYDLQGTLEPYVYFLPTIDLEDGRKLSAFKISHLKNKELNLAQGDVITISKFEDLVPTEIQIVEKSENPRANLFSDKCPACGHKLFKSEHGIGKCLNITCAVNKRRFIDRLLGLSKYFSTDIYKFAVNRLIRDGLLLSPVDALTVHVPFDKAYSDAMQEDPRWMYILEDLETSTLSALLDDVCTATVLGALNIPGMTTDVFSKFMKRLAKRSMQRIWVVEPSALTMFCPDVDWTAWIEFLSIPENRDVVEAIVDICIS